MLARIRLLARRRVAWLRKLWSEEGAAAGRLAVGAGSGVSVGRTIGVAGDDVEKNGWQAVRKTTRVNTSRGGGRRCIEIVYQNRSGL